ncbi:MAG: dephospho-CoA kinase [Deltaproteobacteria bacterium]|nr:dephospho-CoA kinase [Deltaproteobacteria bacterium]
MIVIAITGGLGSGKSTVRRLFEEMGAVGVDADEIARRAVEPGTEGAKRIRAAFGPSFFDGEEHLKRETMASLVFSDQTARKKLESILHPLIRAEEARIIQDLFRKCPDAVVAMEIPLLAEGKGRAGYRAILAVTAPEELKLDRLVSSGRYSRADALARMRNQATDDERIRLADFIVDNGGSIEETRKQVAVIMDALLPQDKARQ